MYIAYKCHAIVFYYVHSIFFRNSFVTSITASTQPSIGKFDSSVVTVLKAYFKSEVC